MTTVQRKDEVSENGRCTRRFLARTPRYPAVRAKDAMFRTFFGVPQRVFSN